MGVNCLGSIRRDCTVLSTIGVVAVSTSRGVSLTTMASFALPINAMTVFRRLRGDELCGPTREPDECPRAGLPWAGWPCVARHPSCLIARFACFDCRARIRSVARQASPWMSCGPICRSMPSSVTFAPPIISNTVSTMHSSLVRDLACWGVFQPRAHHFLLRFRGRLTTFSGSGVTMPATCVAQRSSASLRSSISSLRL